MPRFVIKKVIIYRSFPEIISLSLPSFRNIKESTKYRLEILGSGGEICRGTTVSIMKK